MMFMPLGRGVRWLLVSAVGVNLDEKLSRPVATQMLTFLFTDIDGSTAMLRRLRDAYDRVVADSQRLIRHA
jgi:class 3 adenylate cyclase